jgi:hypothetical protein
MFSFGGSRLGCNQSMAIEVNSRKLSESIAPCLDGTSLAEIRWHPANSILKKRDKQENFAAGKPEYMATTPTTRMKPSSFIAFCTLLAGCTGVSFQGGDALKETYSARVAYLKKTYGTEDGLRVAINAAKIDRTGQERNELLNDFIFLIDNNYYFYEKHLYNKKAIYDFGSDVTATSLSTASGVMTGGAVTSAKSILSLVSGGITSTRSSFSQNILQNQNLLAIVAKMREERAKQLVVLQKGMYKTGTTTATPLSDYSVDQGLVDLANYYQAGTFVSALQAIIDTAGSQKTQADNQTKELKGVPTPGPSKPTPASNGLGNPHKGTSPSPTPSPTPTSAP